MIHAKKSCRFYCGLLALLALIFWINYQTKKYSKLNLIKTNCCGTKRDVEVCPSKGSLTSRSLTPVLPLSPSINALQTREDGKLQAKKWIRVEPSTQVWGEAAYFDNRTDVYGGPVVVVMGFHESRKELQSGISLYCHYSTNEHDICTGEATIYKLEDTFIEKNALVLSSYIVCSLPSDHQPPHSLYFTTHSCCSSHHTPHIPVVTPPTATSLTLGLCLHKALFNIKDPQDIVQFLELHRLLGVQWFTIYTQDIPPSSVKDILESYVAEGIAEVIEWNLNISDSIVRDYGQLSVIHDCLHRNRGRIKYLGFLDFDEVFVPHSHVTLPELLESLDQESYGSFRFMNVFCHSVEPSLLLKTYQPSCAAVSLSKYFTRSHRSDYTESFYQDAKRSLPSRAKVIVKPQNIVRMGRHYMHLRDFHQFAPNKVEHTVPGNLGLMHHYRTPDIRDEVFPLQKDDILYKYSQPLMKAIEKRLCPTASHSD